MALTAGVAPLSLKWINDLREQQQQVERQLSTLHRVQELLVDAETGQRGYIITGKDAFLQPYRTALQTLPLELQRLERHYAGSPAPAPAIIQELLRNAQLKLRLLTETVQLRQSQGFDAVEPVISAAQGLHYMEEVRRLVAVLGERDGLELVQANEELQSKIKWAAVISLASTLMTLGLSAYLVLTTSRTMRQREQAAAQAQQASERLEDGMAALRLHNDRMRALGEMSRALQADMTLVEELEVTSLFCARLLPDTSGSIYLFRNSADQLELAARWGGGPSPRATMAPAACWGLRLGQVHRFSGATDLRCRHCEAAEPAAGEYRLCLPLMAYGEVLGLMHLRGTAANAPVSAAMASIEPAAQAIAEQAALSLSNAKLRQTLRDQSIKDPLTGLFNRRYMEETLLREILRARRDKTCVSVLMVDLDHFKKINDAHGHPAGDAVLRAAAQHLAAMTRASDVACRYGGEEFVLVLVDCDKAAAVAKAQQMCDALRTLTIKEDGRVIAVTASFGVATAPTDAHEPEMLVAAADHALYEAKRAGRDRVVGVNRVPAAAAA